MNQQQYEILENNYVMGPEFYLPLESFVGYYSKDEDELVLSFSENKSITIPKNQSTLAFVTQLCKRHHLSMNQGSKNQGGMKEVKGIIGRIQGDDNVWLWLYFEKGQDHGIPIPLNAVGKVVAMIDSFVFDQYRKYESRLVHLTDSNHHRMGISLLPIKTKVKMWYQMDNIYSFILTFEQLLKIKDVLLCFHSI